MRVIKPVRCAVVGLGMIGQEHAAVLAGSPLADLAACCDVDPGAAARVPGGAKFTSNLGELLDLPGLEAVFVCTQQETHREIAMRALGRGLFVFCEKPVAHTLEDADALISMPEAQDGHLVIGHTLRFSPDYIAIHQAVASGAVGRIVSMAARRCVPDFEGRLIAGRTNLPVEVGIHDIDLMRWLAGDIETVYAEAARMGLSGPELTDAMVGTLRFASGAVATIEINWIMSSSSALKTDYRLAVFGTAGSAFAEFNSPVVRVFGGDAAATGWRDDIYGSQSGTLVTEDEHFLATVRGIRSWPITLQDARAALAAAIALNESASAVRPIRVTAGRARGA
ncbi:MAG TPA: Gfo/Idh/MocA family oxidoreductase [Streptosporangiaceae bacterium]|nr:Gfo/Idh/MocA family oxidoreductase [Streptosporangiaceae bacterium]